MSTRRAKQIIYGVLYAILWLIVVGVVWLGFRVVFPPTPAPVACTSACVPTSTAPLAVSNVLSFVSTPGHDTFLAQIADTDQNYAAPYFDYSIDLYDASGTVLQSIPESSFIYQSQSKYIVVPNVAVGEPFVSAGVVITDADWVASSTLGTIPAFTTENLSAGSTSSTVSVSGQLTNSNIATTGYVFVDAIFNGPDGSPVGASQTELNGVAPGQTVNFSVIYPQTGDINPSASQVVVYGLK